MIKKDYLKKVIEHLQEMQQVKLLNDNVNVQKLIQILELQGYITYYDVSTDSLKLINK